MQISYQQLQLRLTLEYTAEDFEFHCDIWKFEHNSRTSIFYLYRKKKLGVRFSTIQYSYRQNDHERKNNLEDLSMSCSVNDDQQLLVTRFQRSMSNFDPTTIKSVFAFNATEYIQKKRRNKVIRTEMF